MIVCRQILFEKCDTCVKKTEVLPFQVCIITKKNMHMTVCLRKKYYICKLLISTKLNNNKKLKKCKTKDL